MNGMICCRFLNSDEATEEKEYTKLHDGDDHVLQRVPPLNSDIIICYYFPQRLGGGGDSSKCVFLILLFILILSPKH